MKSITICKSQSSLIDNIIKTDRLTSAERRYELNDIICEVMAIEHFDTIKDIKKSIIEIIDNEIKWCNKNDDKALSSDFKKGFTNGLIQAKYLIHEVFEIDKNI